MNVEKVMIRKKVLSEKYIDQINRTISYKDKINFRHYKQKAPACAEIDVENTKGIQRIVL